MLATFLCLIPLLLCVQVLNCFANYVRDRSRSGERASASAFASMAELCHICSLCNDSAIDFNESRQTYEKVGEATEAALICLVEKANFYQLDKSRLSPKELCALRLFSPLLSAAPIPQSDRQYARRKQSSP